MGSIDKLGIRKDHPGVWTVFNTLSEKGLPLMRPEFVTLQSSKECSGTWKAVAAD